MLLPAVNLMNLNTSRILERASEIGVRKAFGASSSPLVGQFIVENVVLTLVGAAVGFVLAGVAAQAINASGADPVRRRCSSTTASSPGACARRRVRPALGRVSGLAHVAAAPGAGAEGSLAMIRHLFKLIWNRKRTNVLMMIEIFVSFLVLFAVVGLGVYMLDNWRRPIGFSIDRVWDVSVDMKQVSDDYFDAAQQETVRQLFLALGEFPEIEGVAGTMLAPTSSARRTAPTGGASRDDRVRRRRGDRRVQGPAGTAADRRAAGLVREDDGQSYDAGRDQPDDARGPLRQRRRRSVRTCNRDESAAGHRVRRRLRGSLASSRHIARTASSTARATTRSFASRCAASDPTSRPPRNLLIKVRAGAAADFEERLIKRLQAAAPGWSFDVTRLSQMREDSIRFAVAPLIAVGLVAGVPHAHGRARPVRRAVAGRDAADARAGAAPGQRRRQSRTCDARFSVRSA